MLLKSVIKIQVWLKSDKYQALYMKTLSMFYTADSNICSPVLKINFCFHSNTFHTVYCWQWEARVTQSVQLNW